MKDDGTGFTRAASATGALAGGLIVLLAVGILVGRIFGSDGVPISDGELMFLAMIGLVVGAVCWAIGNPETIARWQEENERRARERAAHRRTCSGGCGSYYCGGAADGDGGDGGDGGGD